MFKIIYHFFSLMSFSAANCNMALTGNNFSKKFTSCELTDQTLGNFAPFAVNFN